MTYEDIGTPNKRKIEIGLLDEYGEGKTAEYKIVKTLIFTCKEGVDYSNL